MKIYKEESLANFEFWSGAKDTAQRIWEEKGSAGFDTIEQILEDMYPEEMDETEINDLFWFESETIYEWLGMPTEEQAEALETISNYEEKDEDFVEWVCTNYGLDRDDLADVEAIAEYLEDEDIHEEYCEENEIIPLF